MKRFFEKIINAYNAFSKWFEANLGWFFTNATKAECTNDKM